MTPYLARAAARVALEIGGPVYVVTDQDGLWRIRTMPRVGDVIQFPPLYPTLESAK